MVDEEEEETDKVQEMEDGIYFLYAMYTILLFVFQPAYLTAASDKSNGS